MSVPFIRLSLCVIWIASLAGCAAGSNGGSPGASNGPTTITVTFPGTTPTALATQIGSGQYTAVAPAGTITLPLPSGTTNFAVAYVCPVSLPPSGLGPSLEIFQNVVEASSTDGTNLVEPCQSATTTSPATGVLTGSIDGSTVPGVMGFGISQGLGFTGVNLSPANLGSLQTSFSVAEPVGLQRVLVTAYHAVTAPPAPTGSISLLAARNFDNQSVPGALNGGTPVVLGPADETTSQTISYSGVPSGFTNPLTDYTTVAELVMSDIGGVILAGPVTTQYPILPAGATETGDYYLVSTSAGNGQETIFLTRTSPTGIPVVFTFPPAWGNSGFTPAALPTFNVAYSGFTSGSNLPFQASLQWHPDTSTDIFYRISASENSLNNSRSLAFPDLTSLPGFFKPASGATILWNTAISQVAYASTPTSPHNATTTLISDTGRYLVP